MHPVYSDRSHYRSDSRSELFDLLRPFWKDRETDRQEIVDTYGPAFDRFRMVDRPEEADFCVLPMSWNYYIRHKRPEMALAFVKKAASAGKRVLSHVTGDFGVRPLLNDVYVLRCSGYRSGRKEREYGKPVFIRDPLKAHYDAVGVFLRRKGQRPVVGFCGQAKAGPAKSAFDLLRTAGRNLLFHARLRIDEPQSLYPATLRRARALSRLGKSSAVETDFIRRVDYRAGATAGEPLQRTTREFFDNIRDTDYTVCVRGSGNFSARLYETLAMGRIPVFINTDCLLPLDNVIDWRKCVVWCEVNELARLPEVVAAFHHDLHPDDFLDLQQRCRRLWEKNFTIVNFFTVFMGSLQKESYSS